MVKPLLRQILVICLLSGLAACKSGYQILEPVKDSVNTTPPAEYKVGYQTQPQTLPKITLNGVDVAQYFVPGPQDAIAAGSDLASFLKEGQNLFQVDPPLGPQEYFLYDTQGPKIVITHGDGNDPVTITGQADDAAGVASVAVNGTAATVADDGSFTVTVPATDVYRFDAADTLGHTSTTAIAALNQHYNPSLQVRVNQSGIDFASSAIINALNGMDINSLVAGTTLYDNTWQGPSGETYGADGFLDGLTMSAGAFKLDLGPDGTSQFNGTINTAHLQLRLRLHNGLLPPTVINIGATVGPIDFSGDLQAYALNHQPVITLQNFNFQIGNVLLDSVPDAFQPLLSPIIAGIVNLFQGQISNQVESTLKTALPQMFAQIIQDSYTVSINGLNMAMALQLEDITTTDTSLLVTLSGGITPITSNPQIQPPLGSLFTDDNVTPPPEGQGDLAVSVNANVINQTLASAYAVGLTQISMLGNDVQFGLPRDDSLGDEGAQRILVDTMAPPEVRIREENGVAKTTFSINDMTMSLQTKTNGAYTNNFSVRLNAAVDISITTTPDNTLNVTLASTPDVTFTGIAVGNGPMQSGIVNAAANNFVTYAIGQVMEQLTKPIASIQMPSFGCMAFVADSFNAIGDQHHHAGLIGSLTKVSDACDNPVQNPPRIAYGRGVGSPMVCDTSEQYDAGLCYTQCDPGYDGVGPVCWKENASYGRGAGTPATEQCAANEDLDGGLCYPKCKTGYHGVGPVCWADLPTSYGRGAGTIPNLIPYGCPAGKEMDAGLCYVPCDSGYTGAGPVCWLDNASYGRGAGTVPPLVCGAGEEEDGGLCYPVCKDGYHGVGPVCWTNDAVSYTRGAGVPVHTCPTGKELDAGLCYDLCATGYTGIGPVCWPQSQ